MYEIPPTAPGRVLHVISGLTTGGAETALVRLVEATSALGWTHTVISLTGEGTRAAPLRAAGAQVHAVNLRRPREWVGAIRLLRQEARRADLVQGWMYHGNLAAAAATVGQRSTRLLWSVRSSLDGTTGALLTVAVIRAGAICSRRADVIVYNSLRSAEQHVQIGYTGTSWQFIANGFDVDRWQPAADDRERVRSSLNLGPDTRVVGLFARVVPQKDHATFLRAMIAVCASDSAVRILLVGSGTDDDAALGSLIHDPVLRDRVIRLGDRKDVIALYAACDITVLSSLREGFPNVAAESMACGVPCVVTDVGDAASVVGNTGLVIPSSASDALARAVRQLLDESPADRLDRSRRARERVATHFSVNRMRDAYIALWTANGPRTDTASIAAPQPRAG